MDVDLTTAEEDACRLEHAISDKSFQRLKEKLGSAIAVPDQKIY